MTDTTNDVWIKRVVDSGDAFDVFSVINSLYHPTEPLTSCLETTAQTLTAVEMASAAALTQLESSADELTRTHTRLDYEAGVLEAESQALYDRTARYATEQRRTKQDIAEHEAYVRLADLEARAALLEQAQRVLRQASALWGKSDAAIEQIDTLLRNGQPAAARQLLVNFEQLLPIWEHTKEFSARAAALDTCRRRFLGHDSDSGSAGGSSGVNSVRSSMDSLRLANR